MIEILENIDRQLFLFLNGLNAPVIDNLMWHISAHWFWIPIILLFFYYSIKDYKARAWLPILVLVLCFTFTDQASNFFKHFFQRYRPSHNIEIEGLIHHIREYKGGLYGFFSGHTSNSFGLMVLTSRIVARKNYTIIVIIWAVIVSYSRIYLGVHYPSDIFVGAVWGIASGFLFYYIFYLLKKIIFNK
jgi:undecaprenyl-diphosphatase